MRRLSSRSSIRFLESRTRAQEATCFRRQGVAILNVLTSDQHAKLRELTRNPDAVAKLEEEFKTRITAKVERVTRGAEKWARKAVAIPRPLPRRCKRKSDRSWMSEESSRAGSRDRSCARTA